MADLDVVFQCQVFLPEKLFVIEGFVQIVRDESQVLAIVIPFELNELIRLCSRRHECNQQEAYDHVDIANDYLFHGALKLTI